MPLLLAVAALALGGWMMVRGWQLRFTGGMLGGIFFLVVAGYLFFFWFFSIATFTGESVETLPRVIPTITPQP